MVCTKRAPRGSPSRCHGYVCIKGCSVAPSNAGGKGGRDDVAAAKSAHLFGFQIALDGLSLALVESLHLGCVSFISILGKPSHLESALYRQNTRADIFSPFLFLYFFFCPLSLSIIIEEVWLEIHSWTSVCGGGKDFLIDCRISIHISFNKWVKRQFVF